MNAKQYDKAINIVAKEIIEMAREDTVRSGYETDAQDQPEEFLAMVEEYTADTLEDLRAAVKVQLDK